MEEKYSKLAFIWGLVSLTLIFPFSIVALVYSDKAVRAGGTDNRKRIIGKRIAVITLIVSLALFLRSCVNDLNRCIAIPG